MKQQKKAQQLESSMNEKKINLFRFILSMNLLMRWQPESEKNTFHRHT